MMKLVSYEAVPGGAKLSYQVTHATPGREGTVLSSNLTLFLRPDASWCDMVVEGCPGANPKEALDRMSQWLRRLADGIDQRQEITIPA